LLYLTPHATRSNGSSWIYNPMKKIDLFEDYWNRRARSSSFPQRKHSRGVKFIRRLLPWSDELDLEELIGKIKEWSDRDGTYSYFLDPSGEADKEKIKNQFKNTSWEAVSVIRPDGFEDIVILDDDEITEPGEGLGFLTGITDDSKYVFYFPAQFSGNRYAGYDVDDIDFQDIDWDYFKK